MPDFSSGVKEYITGVCTVAVHFPVDFKGREHIACIYCRYYSGGSRYCQLNKEIPEFPDKYVGSMCPLVFPEQKIDQQSVDMFD